MTGDEGICAIRVLFDGGGGEGAGVADRVGVGEEVGVNEPQFPLLEDRVE